MTNENLPNLYNLFILDYKQILSYDSL